MDTRDKLLNLADVSVRHRGFGATSYGSLAQAAKIRKASIHHHFPGKSDLGRALIEGHAERLADALAVIAESARTGADALRGVAALFRSELLEGDSLGLLTALAAERATLPRPMQRPLQAAIDATADWLEETFRRGRQDRSIAVPGEPAAEAIAALAQLTGAQLLARAAGNPLVFDTSVAPLLARTTRH